MRLAALLPYPSVRFPLGKDLGQWLCVPPFRMVCLCQVRGRRAGFMPVDAVALLGRSAVIEVTVVAALCEVSDDRDGGP